MCRITFNEISKEDYLKLEEEIFNDISVDKILIILKNTGEIEIKNSFYKIVGVKSYHFLCCEISH